MAAPLKIDYAFNAEDFESSAKIVKFTILKKHQEPDATQEHELTSFEETMLPHMIVGRIHVRQHRFLKRRQFVFPSGIWFLVLFKYGKLHNLGTRLEIFSVKSIVDFQWCGHIVP